VALLTGAIIPVSTDQTIRVALVTKPRIDSDRVTMNKSHFVRITFQRIVRRTDNSVSYETLTDPERYKNFYEKVSKVVFLEA
jgi:hypothetical protein